VWQFLGKYIPSILAGTHLITSLRETKPASSSDCIVRNFTHPTKAKHHCACTRKGAHYFAYQLDSKAKYRLATYQCLALGHNEMNHGTEQGDFLGQEKLTYGHNKTNFGTEREDFLGQEKSILGLNKINYGT
jgi:hypothetical protein